MRNYARTNEVIVKPTLKQEVFSSYLFQLHKQGHGYLPGSLSAQVR